MTIQLTLTPAQNNWLEVTWTEVTQAPDVVIPATPEVPTVYEQIPDDMGELVQGDLITPTVPGTPERTEPGQITRTELKFTSYHPTQRDLLQADADAMATPLDEHAEMLDAWVAAYVPPEPEPVKVPQAVTMRQARLALRSAGLLDSINTTLASLPSPQKEDAEIEWEYSQEVQRYNGFVPIVAAALGMTDKQIDDLFIAASLL